MNSSFHLPPAAWERGQGGVDERILPNDDHRSGDSPFTPDDTRWDTIPLVLLDGQRVRAATATAGASGIRAGMTAAEAQSRCAALRIARWDEETITHEVMRVTAALVRASPQVTPAAGPPGVWWTGAMGFDSLGGEPALARALSTIARRWHPGARVGIADSCVAARAATWDSTRSVREGDGTVIVPPGGCAAYLASAPLGMLPMEEEQRETLVALGLRTIGAFAALVAEDVERRWGASGLGAWRLARGEDQRRPVLARLAAPRAVSAELQSSAHDMEPVLFLVRAALDRLVHELVADGRAAAVIAITLTLDDARGPIPGQGRPHTVTREVRLSRPMARVIPLFERCRALLDMWTLSAPVAGVRVAITATAPLTGEQGEILDPAWRDPAAADAAFARLRATLGTSAIVRPVVRDTHRPERAGGWEQVDAMDALVTDNETGGVATDSSTNGVSSTEREESAAGACVEGRRARCVNGEAPEGESDGVEVEAMTDITCVAPGRTTLGIPAPSHASPEAFFTERSSYFEHSLGKSEHLSQPAEQPLTFVRDDTGTNSLGNSPSHQREHGAHLSPLPSISSFTLRGANEGGLPATRNQSFVTPARQALAVMPAKLATPTVSHRPALRQLDPPEPVDVACEHNVPSLLRWRGRGVRVGRTVGPERLTGDWWEMGYARDYWRCEDAAGRGDLLIYRERPGDGEDRWFLHGWYD